MIALIVLGAVLFVAMIVIIVAAMAKGKKKEPLGETSSVANEATVENSEAQLMGRPAQRRV